MRHLYFFLLLLLWGYSLSAQTIIRGSVRDADNGQMLVGATVQLGDGLAGVVTDSLGNFRFEQLSPGRYPLAISYLGYQQLNLREVLATTGKEQVLEIQLREAATSLTSITVKASRAPQSNTTGSLLRLSQEETLRFPATFNDPARLAQAYPGLTGGNDQANLLIIRGQSPLGMQWRLEGLEIVNPNHTPNAGTFSDRSTTSGGGVNALSSQLMSEANFHLGNFPAQFGNATAGLLDMRLRSGNNQQREYTIQAGFIGFDVAAEGPFRENGSSYLLNYRYSFTGLLSDLGVPLGDEDIRFQDISYHLAFPGKKGQKLRVFGLSGASTNNFSQSADSSSWTSDKDLYRFIDYTSSTHSHGFSYTRPQSDKGLWRIAGMASWTKNERRADPSDVAGQDLHQFMDARNSLQVSYRRKLLPFGSIRLGAEATQYQRSLTNTEVLVPNLMPTRKSEGWAVSPYIDWRYQIKKVNLQLGYRSSLWLGWLDQKAYSEPRLSVGYTFSKFANVGLAYAVNTQGPSPYVEARQPRRAKQLSLSWNRLFAFKRKLSIVLYEQNLSQFSGQGARSSINQLALLLPSTIQTSEGRTRGAEISFQQFATGGWWYVASASLFDARYLNEQQEWVKTRFAQDYAMALTLGKEWSGPDRDNTTNNFGFNLALRLNGGLRAVPIALAESEARGTTIFDYAAGFSEQLPAYFRSDLRIYFQRNRTKWSSMLSLDIQNFTGQQNTAYRYYDRLLNKIETRFQLEFIPILSYRINF